MTLHDALYGSADMTTVMYGRDARHVPAWLYVQDQGGGIVGLVGSSKVTGSAHPLLYGSSREHLFIVGEIVVRPHFAVATDALRGMGVGGLYTSNHEFGRMLADGELVAGSEEVMQRMRDQWR